MSVYIFICSISPYSQLTRANLKLRPFSFDSLGSISLSWAIFERVLSFALDDFFSFEPFDLGIFFCHACDLYFFCLEEIFSMFIRMIYLGIMTWYVYMNLLLYPTRISFQPISFCLSSFGFGTFMLKNIKESQQLFSKILGCNAIFIVRVMLA